MDAGQHLLQRTDGLIFPIDRRFAALVQPIENFLVTAGDGQLGRGPAAVIPRDELIQVQGGFVASAAFFQLGEHPGRLGTGRIVGKPIAVFRQDADVIVSPGRGRLSVIRLPQRVCRQEVRLRSSWGSLGRFFGKSQQIEGGGVFPAFAI